MASEEPVPLCKYVLQRWAENKSGIFFGSLVAGLFLDYLMEDSEECEVPLYPTLFLAIGMLHYVIRGISALLVYFKKVHPVCTAL